MGTGATGQLISYAGPPLRLKANNQFDADMNTLKSTLGAVMAWTPTPGTQLTADFDNGSSSQDGLANSSLAKSLLGSVPVHTSSGLTKACVCNTRMHRRKLQG